ncbi:MAG: SbcC/MukB-like Walker B domain-containing protein [Bacteroidota bacterium]
MQIAYLLPLFLPENPDLPCPVCGSREHPHIATETTNFISDEEREKIKQIYDNARKQFETVSSDLKTSKDRLENLKEQGQASKKRLGEYAEWSEKQFTEAKTNEETKFKTAQKSAEQLPKLQEKLSAVKIEEETLSVQKQSADTILQEAKTQVAILEKEVAGFNENLQEFTDVESLQKAIAKEEKNIKSIEEGYEVAQKAEREAASRLTKARSEQENAQKVAKEEQSEREHRTKSLEEKAQSRGFESANEAHENLQTAELREELESKISEWEKHLHDLKRDVEKEANALTNHTEPDLKALAIAEKNAKTTSQTLEKQIAQYESEIQRLQKQQDTVQELVTQLKKQTTELEPYVELAELAAGQGTIKQTFQSYVLSVLLDEVLRYANIRLRTLTQNRYELLRKEAEAGGRKKVGLELETLDHFNQRRRDTVNLSGGETFLTSLALALGLSDGVTAQVGSRANRLETLFIDEGFGTLDPETLNLAFDTLCQLEDGRRLVGIISHVTELKSLIPKGIEVLKGRTGSQLKWRGR